MENFTDFLTEGYGIPVLDKYHDIALRYYKNNWKEMVSNDIAPNISWGTGIKKGKPLIVGLNWGYKSSIKKHHSQMLRKQDDSDESYQERVYNYIDTYSSKGSAHIRDNKLGPFDKNNPASDFKFQKNFFQVLEKLDLLKSTQTRPSNWGQMQLVPVRSMNDAALNKAGLKRLKEKSMNEWVPKIIKDLNPPVSVVSYAGVNPLKWGGVSKVDLKFTSSRTQQDGRSVKGLDTFVFGDTLVLKIPHVSQFAYRITSELENYSSATKADAERLRDLLSRM